MLVECDRVILLQRAIPVDYVPGNIAISRLTLPRNRQYIRDQTPFNPDFIYPYAPRLHIYGV